MADSANRRGSIPLQFAVRRRLDCPRCSSLPLFDVFLRAGGGRNVGQPPARKAIDLHLARAENLCAAPPTRTFTAIGFPPPSPPTSRSSTTGPPPTRSTSLPARRP